VTDFEEPRSAWRKSTASDSGGCIEVAAGPGLVLIRDSKDRGGAILGVSSVAWSYFLDGMHNRDAGPA
jgi:uncharacterized protein DUF397